MNLGKVERILQQDILGMLEPLGVDLEGLLVRPAGHRILVRVLVDKDGGVTLDEVAEISRQLSALFDSSNPLGEKSYTLEISSPGTERPLTLARHWRRNVGRNVRVRFRQESEPVIGRVLSVSETSAILDVEGSRSEIGFEAVDKAIIQVELKSKERARDVETRENT